MELGSWSIIQAPSLLALIPLVIMIVMAFMGKNNVSGMMVGIIAAALLMGQDLSMLASAFADAMGSFTAMIGFIIMLGAGLGVLMTETGVSQTMVWWIVKKIGVNTQTKAKIALVICSILVCGMLGTLGGGNAVISPILLPIMASLGLTPTVVATLFKTAGEIGLILGPLTGVTLVTCDLTGLSYGQLMLQACLPFAFFWMLGTWIGCNKIQKLTEGKESFTMSEDLKDMESFVATPKQIRTTVIFLIAFVALIAYGIITGQGTTYALIVMIALCCILTVAAWIDIDKAVAAITKGVASQANMFLIFITIEVLLNYVTLGGGFDALADLLGGLAEGGGATAVMLAASVVGGFGIEASAAAEIQIIFEMFGGMAANVGMPMGCMAVAMLAATRLTGSMYPTSNLVGQMGTAQCTNIKGAMQAMWYGVFTAWAFVLVYAFIGPMILG